MTTQNLAGEGERRLVTVLFADLVGYTTVSETRDPEEMQEALNLCFDRLGSEIQRFGGYVDKIVGDEIMALFGAPRAQEDDAGKAIAAGLAMQVALQELLPQLEASLGAQFKMRVGINTGLVVTGAVGPGAYTVTGDAVNVAARLESQAPHGGVLVGETTRRLARRQFEWGARQQLTVKGRAEPVICFTVEGSNIAPLRLVPAPSETPFVGRDEYLERLAAMWKGGTRERVVELVGEAGIGKTRFLAHFLALNRVAADQVIYSRADTPPRTFGPLLQLLPSLSETLPEATRDRLDQLATAGEEAESFAVPRDWLVQGLVEVLTDLTKRGPVAFVLDDVHRADQATIDVMEQLLPRLSSLPVLVLLLRQPLGRRPRRLPAPAEVMTLSPLAQPEARALVLAAAPDLAGERADEIVKQAGGNPLYLEVLASAARSSSMETIPDSLQTAVAARIDDLDETGRTILREASTFGQSFYEEPFKRATTVSEGVYEALAHLCAVGLLQEVPATQGRAYEFRHSLVQQILYDGLLRRRRLAMHMRAAEALELAREEGLEIEPEQIAYHYERAGESQRAAVYHLASAERADQLHAADEARNHRRAASRLLSFTSLADLYGPRRLPSFGARILAALVQIGVSLLLVAPIFLLLATSRPAEASLTLGLPLAIVDFNVASILIAVAIGGIPLLFAGVLFTHLAAPLLLRRHVSWAVLLLTTLGGWLLAIASVVAGFLVLMLLMRLALLDRLASIYVGASTLRTLLGDYSLVLVTIVGTLVVAFSWTMLLRLQAASWARTRRSTVSPRQLEEGRRWAALRQVGLLLALAGGASALCLLALALQLFPNSEEQGNLDTTAWVVLVVFAIIAVIGLLLFAWARTRLRATVRGYRGGLLGFEVPLLAALAFGLVAWFGMREAVIVSANNVDTPGSVAPFDRAVNLFPDLGLAFYLRGERYLALHGGSQDDADLRAALADFTRASELDADFPATYLARGRVLISLGRYDDAILDAERLIELRPDHPGGYAIRALARAENGDLTGAAEDVAVATRPLPPDARGWDAYFVRCIALAAVDRNEEARADCEHVLEINPDQLVALDQLLILADRDADYESALRYADRILELTPDNGRAWSNRGLIHRLLGNYEEAESDLSRAIEIDPEDARAYQDRAVTRLYLDRVEDALADADAGVLLDPSLYYTRLYVARYADEHEIAIQDASTLISAEGETSPNLSYLYSARGLAYVETGAAEQGMADLDASLRLDPEQAAIYDRRGYARYLLGDYAGAEQDFNAGILRIGPLPPQGRAELYYHRALVLSATGRSAAATADLDEALENVEIPVVRQQIERLRETLAVGG